MSSYMYSIIVIHAKQWSIISMWKIKRQESNSNTAKNHTVKQEDSKRVRKKPENHTPKLKFFNIIKWNLKLECCNPSTLGGRGRWITRSRDRDHPGQHGETPSLLKIQKISWAWWRMPVIPATQEAEAGELPEPRRQRLRWAKIMPLHSSLGNNSEMPSQKKKNYDVTVEKLKKLHNWLK